MLTAEEQSRAGFLASIERFEWAGDRTRLDRIECDSEAAAIACLIEENAKGLLRTGAVMFHEQGEPAHIVGQVYEPSELRALAAGEPMPDTQAQLWEA